MIRSSKLQTAEYCGLAGSYEEKTSGVYALAGNGFQAYLRAIYRPDDREAIQASTRALAQLAPGDRELVMAQAQELAGMWAPPPAAKFEDQMALDIDGRPVPYNDPRAITRGSTDCWWLAPNTIDSPAIAAEPEIDALDGIDAGRFASLAAAPEPPAYSGTYTLYVVDFKQGPRAEFNVPPPADNLQLASYALGLLEKCGKIVTDVRLGLYLVVARKFVWLKTDAATLFAMWDRVRTAALRDPDVAVTGAHCVECYARKKCRAYLQPALAGLDSVRESIFAPLFAGTEEEGEASVDLSDDKVAQMLVGVKAIEELAEQAKDWAKNHVKMRGAPIVSGTKEWGPRAVKGSERTSIKALKDAGIYEQAVAAGAVKLGEPTEAFTWGNRK